MFDRSACEKVRLAVEPLSLSETHGRVYWGTTRRTCAPAAAQPPVVTGSSHRGTVFEAYRVGRKRMEV